MLADNFDPGRWLQELPMALPLCARAAEDGASVAVLHIPRPPLDEAMSAILRAAMDGQWRDAACHNDERVRQRLRRMVRRGWLEADRSSRFTCYRITEYGRRLLADAERVAC